MLLATIFTLLVLIQVFSAQREVIEGPDVCKQCVDGEGAVRLVFSAGIGFTSSDGKEERLEIPNTAKVVFDCDEEVNTNANLKTRKVNIVWDSFKPEGESDSLSPSPEDSRNAMTTTSNDLSPAAETETSYTREIDDHFFSTQLLTSETVPERNEPVTTPMTESFASETERSFSSSVTNTAKSNTLRSEIFILGLDQSTSSQITELSRLPGELGEISEMTNTTSTTDETTLGNLQLSKTWGGFREETLDISTSKGRSDSTFSRTTLPESQEETSIVATEEPISPAISFFGRTSAGVDAQTTTFGSEEFAARPRQFATPSETHLMVSSTMPTSSSDVDDFDVPTSEFTQPATLFESGSSYTTEAEANETTINSHSPDDETTVETASNPTETSSFQNIAKHSRAQRDVSSVRNNLSLWFKKDDQGYILKKVALQFENGNRSFILTASGLHEWLAPINFKYQCDFLKIDMGHFSDGRIRLLLLNASISVFNTEVCTKDPKPYNCGDNIEEKFQGGRTTVMIVAGILGLIAVVGAYFVARNYCKQPTIRQPRELAL